MAISSKIEHQKFSGLNSFDFQRVLFADSSALTHVQHCLIERQSIGKINALFYRQEKYCWASELSNARVLGPYHRVQLKLMAALKLSGLLEFLLGPVIVPRPIGPVNA